MKAAVLFCVWAAVALASPAAQDDQGHLEDPKRPLPSPESDLPSHDDTIYAGPSNSTRRRSLDRHVSPSNQQELLNFRGNASDQDSRQHYQDGNQNNKNFYQAFQDGSHNSQNSSQNYQDSRLSLEERKHNFQDARLNYQDKKQNYQDERQNYQDERNNYQDGRHNYQDGRQNYQDGRQNFQTGIYGYNDRRNNYQSNKHNIPPYWSNQGQQFNPYAQGAESFQASSYVQDVVPSVIFLHEARGAGGPFPHVPIKTATATERPNTLARLYVDKHDVDEGLSKWEERVKIFYDGNYNIVPPFFNMKKEEESRKQQNRLFNYFKTQRANHVQQKV